MKTGRREKPKRKMPPWLIGLVLALIISVIALLVLDALGYGDDPSVGALGIVAIAVRRYSVAAAPADRRLFAPRCDPRSTASVSVTEGC